ncbi:MAG: response regulator transcription factor [Candidatus Xenobia bacterium]
MERVLVVDDEEPILDFVEMGLRMEGFEVLRATDGRTGLRIFHEQTPNAVVLDILLPDLDGLEVCRQIRSVSNVPILMLTAKGALEDKVLGLETGADDYLPKPFKVRELQARIRALLRRAHLQVGNVVTFEDISLDRASRTVQRGDKVVSLTAREFELLDLLMMRPKQVFSREQILTHLWGFDYDGESNVVEVHMRALRQKLGDTDRRLIRAVRGVGYTLGG